MTELVWPNGLKIEPKQSDPYGPRKQYYINGAWTRKWHTGTDHYGIGIIRNIGPGTVVENSYSSWAGWQVLVYLGVIAGRKTWVRYCHLARQSALSVGKAVARGAIIGQEGQTGQAAGDHLHWEIYRGSVDRGDGSGPASTVDPRAFVKLYLTPKSKGLIVIPYNKEDATAKADKPRILKPGDSFWLNTVAGAPTKNASSVVGGIGWYEFLVHTYFRGQTVGDLLSLTLWWGTPDKGATSPHYPEDLAVTRSGFILHTQTPWHRTVTAGQTVYLKVQADSGNKSPIEVLRLVSDSCLIK